MPRPRSHRRLPARLRGHVRPEALEARSMLSAVPLGGQHLVHASVAPPEAAAEVAFVDETGGFVAVWQARGADGDGFGVMAGLFDRSGAPLGGAPVVVDEPLADDPPGIGLGNQFAPAIASDGRGGLIVAWQGEDRGAGGYDIHYRLGRVTEAGLEFDPQQRANRAIVAGDQVAPAVAMDAAGRFVIVWQTDAPDGTDVVFRAGSIADGLADADEVSAAAGSAGDQTAPAVAIDATGRFVVVWRGPDATAVGEEGETAGGIFLRAFAAGGVPASADTRANAVAYHDLGAPDVALDDTGRVAVAWQVEGQPESGSDVHGRRFTLGDGDPQPLATGDSGTGDFRINAATERPQRAVAVGLDADGDLFAVWQTQHQDGYSWAIAGRRLDAATATWGAEFVVNNLVAMGPQISPDVAVAPGGRTAVVWVGPDVPTGAEEGEGGHLPAIHARLFDDAGATAAGDELTLATFVGLEDVAADLAVDAAGNAVVVWQEWQGAGDGSDFGIYAKLLQADGTWLDLDENGVDDDTLLVNATTGGGQTRPAVAMDRSGNFVVVWQDDRLDGSRGGIFGRRYDASLAAWGAEGVFAVNLTTAGDQTDPDVAMDGEGNFTVVWTSPDADGTGIVARRFAADGTPRPEGERQVNAEQAFGQVAPAIAMNAAGQAVVAWVSDHGVLLDPADTEKSIFLRAMAADGSLLGAGETPASVYRKDAQEYPAVGVAASGAFVVAWQSINQEMTAEQTGSSWGVYARRFAVDPAGGGVAAAQPVEFRVNQTVDGPQRFPAVGVDESGRFTIAWQSIRQDGGSWGVLARSYGADGTAEGGEAVVNAFTTGPQILPAVSRTLAGDPRIVWTGQGTGRVDGVWMRRYRAIHDDFDRGSAPSLGTGWITRSGDFDVHDDVALVQSGRARATVASVSLVDVAVEARIVLGGAATTSAGVVARHRGGAAPSFIWGGLERRGDAFYAGIGRTVGGVYRTLVTVPVATGAALVRLEVLGDSLKLFVDGVRVAGIHNGAVLGSGGVGIGGGHEGTFDDFAFDRLERGAARIPFRDPFLFSAGSPLGRAWVERSGEFVIDGYRSLGVGGVNLATLNGPTAADAALTARVLVASAGEHAGIVARVGSAGKQMYWGGLVNRGGVLSAEIWHVSNGTIRRLGALRLAAESPAKDHSVRLDASGTLLELAVDGAPAVSVRNGLLRGAGSLGMRASRGASIAEVTVMPAAAAT